MEYPYLRIEKNSIFAKNFQKEAGYHENTGRKLFGKATRQDKGHRSVPRTV
jgi:hypothetical protein